MIGDSAKDDVVCGNRAGAVTILLDTEGRYNDPASLEGECKPTVVAKSLAEVHELLQNAFEFLPPQGLQDKERKQLQQKERQLLEQQQVQ